MEKGAKLHDLFNQAATRYPNNVAITYTDGIKQDDYTYHQLNTTACQISSCLQKLCKEENLIVGVYSRQIPGLTACLLAILEMPAAFAPIGLDWPPHMAKEFLESLHPKLTLIVVDVVVLDKFKLILQLIERDSQRKFKFAEDGKYFDSYGFALLVVQDEFSLTPTPRLSLAYVMQTSGTTGQPKIVKVKCIVPNITSLVSIFGITTGDSVALVSPYTFDPFIVQLFIALSTGSRVVIIPDTAKLQSEKLCQLLFDNSEKLQISVFQPTPSLVYFIGQEKIMTKMLGKNSPLRVLAFGGEACPPLSTIRQWKHPDCKTSIFNIYGITEVSCWASCYEIKGEDTQHAAQAMDCIDKAYGDVMVKIDYVKGNVPLGLPLDDTVIEVRDENGSKIDKGVGCIFIGGRNRVCYLDNETSCTPGTMRSTGDVGYISCGQIFYCGRKDRQIKRLGKRMSLDWLEQSISKAFPDLIFSAVLKDHLIINQQLLYLFVKPTSSYDESSLPVLLRKAFHDYLPDYAQPDHIVIVDAIPMTSHGKVDTKNLLRSLEKEISSPQKSVKKFLTDLWVKGVGGVEENTSKAMSPSSNSSLTDRLSTTNDHCVQNIFCDVKKGINPYVKNEENFVESGGTSIDALRMANEVEAWLQVGARMELPELVDVILNGTFGRLCDYVENKLSISSGYSDVFSTDIRNGLGNNEKNIGTASALAHNDESPDSLLTPKSQSRNTNTETMNSKPDGTANDSEDITFSSKRRKIESKMTPTDLSFCYCSMARGRRVTLCALCRKSSTLSNPGKCCEMTPRHFEHGFSLKWKTDFHKCIDASPIVVGAKDNAVVYLGSHAHIFKAVVLCSGKVLWETRVGDRVESSAALSQCGLYVIVGCYDGKVYTLDRHDGAVVWIFQTGGPVKSSPCVDPSSGYVWIGSHDHHLHVLDVCRRVCVSSVYCGSSCFSSPCVHQDLAFIGTLGGRIIAVNTAKLAIEWSKQCPKPIFSSPLPTAQGVICACVDGLVYCYGRCGSLLWEYQTSGVIFSTPCTISSSHVETCGGDIVFGSHDEHVYCITALGQLKWRFGTDSPVYSTAFVAILCSGDSTKGILGQSQNALCSGTSLVEDPGHIPCVLVCSTRGTLYCLTPDRGFLLASFSFPGPVFSSPVAIGNDVLVGCRDDYLYCVNVTWNEKRG